MKKGDDVGEQHDKNLPLLAEYFKSRGYIYISWEGQNQIICSPIDNSKLAIK